jgi:hypothetical protein
MDRPKTNNLTAWIQGRNLNVFQKADAVIEYNHLLDYISEKEQLILSGVSKSFKTELEMHEIATEKYQEHNFGDAKYDGFMDCYRMLVKETKNNTSLSK